MKNYDCVLAEYIKYNNESWKIIEENTKLLENFAAYIVNLANDSRIMGSQKNNQNNHGNRWRRET